MKNYIALFLICITGVQFFPGCDNSKTQINSLEDAKHAKIGVMTGTTGEQLAIKRFPEASIKSFDDVMDAIAALKSDQISAVITAYPTSMNVCKKNKELHFLDEAVDFENTAMAMRKGEDKLLSELNSFIDELTNDGTLKDMKRRWFKTETTPYEEADIKMPVKGQLLRIGVSATREPFCYVDANKRVTGHDGELARRVAAKLGRPVEFVDMKFSALITALQSGKIDLIISGMTATEERRKSVDFTKSYFLNSQVMIAKKPTGESISANNGSAKFKSIDDIKDKRIGVLLGSVHDTYTMKNYPKATVLQYKSPPELVLAVKSGKVDAAMYTHETLLEILREEKELKLLGDTLFTIPIAMGFNQQNDALRESFNTFLQKIKEDGVFKDMVDRWLFKNITDMPVIKNSKTNGILTVGTVSDKGLPFTVVRNNIMIGFDIELAERFAAFLEKELKLVDMEFGSLIIAASTKKIDMIASTLMVTEERAKQIDFSLPYYRLGASVFTLKKNVASNDIKEKPAETVTFFDGIANSFHNNIIVEKRYLLILDGLKTTAIISILSIIFGTLLGALVCLMRMSKKKTLLVPAKIYISLLRGTPVLVILMIIFYVVFASVDIDPAIVAVIAFGMNFAAYVSEMFRTGIEGVDNGQTEAGIAMGFSKIKTFIYIVF